MEVSLQHYLQGHAMRKAMMEFEDALYPFVKRKVQAYFPEDPTDPRTIAYTAVFNAELVTRTTARDLQLEALIQELAHTTLLLDQLQPQLAVKDKTAKQQAKPLQKQKLNIENELSDLDDQETEDMAKTPDPRWIHECREVVGRKTKPFVNSDNRWDVFTRVQVMRGFIPQIFSSTFPDDLHAKEFLTGILRVVEARNGRAHQQSHFIESDALTAMSQMIQVLRLCKSDVTADNVNAILKEAKVLVDTARTSGTATPTPTPTSTKTQVVSLDAREYNAQLAYLSINNFCVHIDSEVGTHFFQDRGIAFGKDLDSKWTAVIKVQKENFKTIVELRH